MTPVPFRPPSGPTHPSRLRSSRPGALRRWTTAFAASAMALSVIVLSANVAIPSASAGPQQHQSLRASRPAPATQPVASPGRSSAVTAAAPGARRAALAAAVRRRAEALIASARRLVARLAEAVGGSATVTGSDRAELQAAIAAATSEMVALDAKVSTDTTLAQLRSDLESFVADRIYAVVAVKTYLVLAADTEAAVERKALRLEAVAQKVIQAAATRGVDVTAAEAALAGLDAQVRAAQSATSGVAQAVLAVVPAGYPGNRDVLAGARSGLVSARGDLRSARAELGTIVRSLHL